MSTSIVEVIVEAAARTPDRPAILEKRLGRWHTRTIGEIAADAGDFAAGLAGAGLAAGDTVALMLDNHAEAVTLDLGVMAAGGVSLHLPPDMVDHDLGAVLEMRSPRVMVVQGQHEADRMLELRDAGGLASLETLAYIDPAGVSEYVDPLLAPVEELRGNEPLSNRVPPEPEAPAVAVVDLTESPDVIMHSHRSLLAGAKATIDAFGLGESDRIVAARPIGYPGERTMTMYAALVAGARLAIPESRATVRLAIREVTPTYVHLATRSLKEIADELLVRFSENRRIKALLARWWRNRTGATVTSYGRERPPSGLGRLVVGRPALEKVGLEEARIVAVSGEPMAADIPSFLRSLGLGVSEVVTDPVVAGPLLINGAPVPECSVDPTGVLTVSGDQVATAPDTSRATGFTATPTDAGFALSGRVGTEVRTPAGSVPAAAIERRIVVSPLVTAALATDGADGVDVLIELARGPVSRWAQQQRLEATTYRSFATIPELVDLLEETARDAVQAEGGSLARAVIAMRPWSEIEGALAEGTVPRRQVLLAAQGT